MRMTFRSLPAGFFGGIVVVVVVIALTLSATALPCRAEIAAAANKDAFTEHDYRRQLLEYNRRTSVDAYEAVGKKDPKWDNAATALLDGVARGMSDADAGW